MSSVIMMNEILCYRVIVFLSKLGSLYGMCAGEAPDEDLHLLRT